MAGATNATLLLPNVNTNQAGFYQVQIDNAFGSTNSRSALLAVNPGPAATNGYITAVLRSECANAPLPPPPVGGTTVGTNYVIMTVADGNPTDFQHAQQVVTDAIFESLMPLYCALPRTTNNCVSDLVQWGVITYDADGHSVISGCAASGCQFHSCGASGAQTLSPVLAISLPNTNVCLSWSTMAADFVLETSSNMADWYPLTSQATTNFDTLSAQLPSQGSSPFFRLHHK